MSRSEYLHSLHFSTLAMQTNMNALVGLDEATPTTATKMIIVATRERVSHLTVRGFELSRTLADTQCEV